MKHSPIHEAPSVVSAASEDPPADDYWHGLIDENVAADFLDVTPRTMQKKRQDGTGPPFVRLSARCVKYTRIRLRGYAEARLVTSTSDPGLDAAAAS